tara:strand:+ start:425 stop:673 length:249 start_codon:yes stop_codon:yes gene_type:complete
MQYDFELKKVIQIIKEKKAKKVLLQLGDGVKPQGTDIVNQLRSETDAEIILWLETCYGVCDVPKTDCDLVIQFGHNKLQPIF